MRGQRVRRLVVVVATFALMIGPSPAQVHSGRNLPDHPTTRAPEISAIWQGTYVADAEAHRLSIEIAKDEQGAWKAAHLSVEFVREPLIVDAVKLDGDQLNFTVNQSKGLFVGKLSPDSTTITGIWKYGSLTAVPLELRKVTKETAWQVPFLYQYHYKSIHYDRPSVDEAKIQFSERLAVEYMEKSPVAWEKDWQCVSCHTNGTYMVVRPLMTQELGMPDMAQRQYLWMRCMRR